MTTPLYLVYIRSKKKQWYILQYYFIHEKKRLVVFIDMVNASSSALDDFKYAKLQYKLGCNIIEEY